VLARAPIEVSDRVHDQCVLETHLAAKLRTAERADRIDLYGQIYDEYSERFPKSLPIDSKKAELIAQSEMSFLRRFVTLSTIMVEVGPDAVTWHSPLTPLVQKIYGVDVSAGIANRADDPPNFELRLTDGVHLPFDGDSVDLVFSNQLMEHLHPDDASAQLQEIYRVLRNGGSYICVTPNRANGPHDCSAYSMTCLVRSRPAITARRDFI
jgi:SAM-dependent methyltransferase